MVRISLDWTYLRRPETLAINSESSAGSGTLVFAFPFKYPPLGIGVELETTFGKKSEIELASTQ